MPSSRNPPNFFAGPYIDRRSEAREDPAALALIRADPSTRYVLSVGGQQLLYAAESGNAVLSGIGTSSLVLTRTAGLFALPGLILPVSRIFKRP